MSNFSRRRFLAATSSTLPALALTHYGCGPTIGEGTKGGRLDSGIGSPGDGGSGEDSGDTDSDSGAHDSVVLADTGPELENRWPGSLTEGGELEQDTDLQVLSGALPEDMVGHSFVTYPIPMDDDAPQFIGDGMVMRLDFRPDGVGMVRRKVRTPCYYADLATRGTDAEFVPRGMARMSLTLGVRNPLNTAFLVMDDRLLMTYDGGRPWEIDPVSLAPVTPVGAFDEWQSMMPTWASWLLPWPFPLVLASAHPICAPDTKEMFGLNFGQQAALLSGFARVVRWDGAGAVESWNMVDESGNNVEILQSGHQVAVTQDYVIVVDVALRTEWESTFGLDAARAQVPDTTVWVVPRAQLFNGAANVRCTRVTVPRECTHFLVDYLNPGGEITLYISHNCATDVSEFLEASDANALTGGPVRPDMVGFFASGTDVNALGRYVIDVDSASIVDSAILFDDQCMTGTAALYTHKGVDVPDMYENVYWSSLGYSEDLRLTRIEELYNDYPYRTRAISDMPEATEPGSLFRVYQPTMEIRDRYIMPNGRIPISPQFVPRAGSTSDTDGYIVAVVVSDDTETAGSTGDEIWVFDAANLAQGPLVRLGHPDLNLPFTLHSCWMPAIAPRTASYQIRLLDDIGEAVSRQSAEIRDIFAREVYPRFA